MNISFRFMLIFLALIFGLSLLGWFLDFHFASYLLMVTAVFGIIIWIIQLRGKIQTLRDDSEKSDFKILQTANEQLRAQKKNIDSLIIAVKKIQDGSYSIEDDLGLDGEAKRSVDDLQLNLLKLREQERQQNWVVNGLAKLAEIRKNSLDLKDYAFQLLSTLVKYLDANQGAFYLLNKSNEEEKLDLMATYAYGKRKYSDQAISVDVGNGLVGQCVLEKELIFMTDVPNNYIKITSGLGEATPGCIVITPLLFREQVYGVIEFASFEEFTDYQVEFIKKVSESIGAELADVLRQETTARLLAQSQKQEQELKSQEEELRQNMEEMAATQEEMKRKEVQLVENMTNLEKAQEIMKSQEVELKEQLAMVLGERRKNQAVLEGCVDGVVSFGTAGIIQFVNAATLQMFGHRRFKLMAKPISKLLDIRIKQKNGDYFLETSNDVEIGVRTKVSATDSEMNEISVLVTGTKVILEEGVLFTLFIQKVE